MGCDRRHLHGMPNLMPLSMNLGLHAVLWNTPCTDAARASLLLVGVYVDDLVITGADGYEIMVFNAEMRHLFKMSDLGLLSYYLGIEVK